MYSKCCEKRASIEIMDSKWFRFSKKRMAKMRRLQKMWYDKNLLVRAFICFLFFGRNVFKYQSTCATILIYLLRSTHEIYVNASVLWLLYIGSIRWMSLNQRYIVDDNFIHNTFTIHHTDAYTHIGDAFHRSINCKDKILST